MNTATVTIQNILLIQIIVTIIIDITGFIDSLKTGIGKLLHISDTGRIRLKPFDCSLCMTWWTGLTYLLVTDNATLPYIAFLLLLAISTDITQTIIYTIKDITITLIERLQKDIEAFID